jgi:hypothetical protein
MREKRIDLADSAKEGEREKKRIEKIKLADSAKTISSVERRRHP